MSYVMYVVFVINPVKLKNVGMVCSFVKLILNMTTHKSTSEEGPILNLFRMTGLDQNQKIGTSVVVHLFLYEE